MNTPRLLRLFSLLVVAAFASLALAYSLGLMLPRQHLAVTSAVIPAESQEVWDAVRDPGTQASWRSDLTSAERLPDREGRELWMQHGDDGDWPVELLESEPPHRLVTNATDPDQGYGGTWTFELEPLEGGATRLTIRESGFVEQPVYRFVARFLVGLHASHETWLRDLGHHFGANVRPRRGS
jgi:uncharacterized protein YndB with AHSA1/START domain